MPAAAVIPAPIAYIKVVAVKKLVVGFREGRAGLPQGTSTGLFKRSSFPGSDRLCSWLSVAGTCRVYFEKIRVFKAGHLTRLDT